MISVPEDLILCTEAEAAQILRIEVKTLQNWRWNGRGPRYVKPSRTVLYRLSDLQSYVRQRLSPEPRPPAP